MQPLPFPTPEGPVRLEDAARLQRRFYRAWQQQGAARRGHRIVLGPVDAVLMVCLTLCLFAIGLGLDRMYPVVRPSVGHAVTEDLPRRPFPSCEAAHEAGVFSIPRTSRAYSPDQDGNGNGLACEPG